MTHSTLLFEILLLLAITASGLALFERLKLPAIAGFLCIGAIAGPGVLGLVPEPDRVRTLTELGVVFLLFEIGLELPIDRARKVWRSALLAGGLQVGLTLAVVFAVARISGMSAASSFVLGGVITMSSTALVLKLLSDQGQIGAPHGQLATSVLLVQDLSVVPLLLVIPLLAEGSEITGASLAIAGLEVIAALVIVLFIVQFAVPYALDRMTRLRSPDLFSLLALIIVLGSAFLAESLGLTLAVGAFLAGVTAAASPHAHQLFSEVVPLRGVVLGVFFTAVGMLFDPVSVIEQAPLVIAILAATTILKAGIVALTCCLVLGQGIRVGVLAGLALAQCGEFSFVLAEAAMRAGVLDGALHQAVIASSILSLIATPFLVRAAPAVANRCEAFADALGLEAGRRTHQEVSLNRAGDEAEVIVVGHGPAGRTLTQLFRSLDISYLVIDANAHNVREGLVRGEPILFGDAARPVFLERLNFAHVKLIAVAISDRVATRRIVLRMRALAPAIPILARTRFVHEVDALEAHGSTAVVAEEFEGSLELVRQALGLFGYPQQSVRSFTDALREDDYGMIRNSDPGQRIDPWLVELLTGEEPEWVPVPERFRTGASLAELNIRARTGASVVAVDRLGQVDSVPAPGFALHAGDRLLVLGDAVSLESLRILLDKTCEAPA